MSLLEKNLQELKEQLEKEAGEIEAQLKMEKNVPEYGTDTEGASFEEEADEAEEFGKQLGVHQVLKERLINIEEALDKIIRGKYGKCEKCQKEISLEILKAVPESKFCKACKTS